MPLLWLCIFVTLKCFPFRNKLSIKTGLVLDQYKVKLKWYIINNQALFQSLKTILKRMQNILLLYNKKLQYENMRSYHWKIIFCRCKCNLFSRKICVMYFSISKFCFVSKGLIDFFADMLLSFLMDRVSILSWEFSWTRKGTKAEWIIYINTYSIGPGFQRNVKTKRFYPSKGYVNGY